MDHIYTNTPLRIAHIAPIWYTIPPQNYGGTENVIANLVNEQISQGEYVTLFASANSVTQAKLISFIELSLTEQNIPWEDHQRAYFHYFKSFEYIKNHPQDFDIIHLHLSSFSDMYLIPLSKDLPVPYCITLHSEFPFERIQGWRGGEGDTMFLTLNPSIPFIFISEYAKKEALILHPELSMLTTIPHGLPDIYFREYELPRTYLSWLGRIIPEKGTHLALQTAIRKNRKLKFAGIVDKKIEAAKNYFDKKVYPLLKKNSSLIEFLGPVNQSEKIAFLNGSYGFLNPIQWNEPFGLVMIEAMAAGVPVISFRNGAASEIISDGISGFLVDNIQQMIKKVSDLEGLSKTTVRNFAKEHYSLTAINNRYKREVYLPLIKRGA